MFFAKLFARLVISSIIPPLLPLVDMQRANFHSKQNADSTFHRARSAPQVHHFQKQTRISPRRTSAPLFARCSSARSSAFASGKRMRGALRGQVCAAGQQMAKEGKQAMRWGSRMAEDVDEVATVSRLFVIY